MPPRRKAAQGPAAEAVGFRLNEGPVRAPRLPFTATYVGDGVVSIEGVGLFARWTRAAVDATTAERLRGDPCWEVLPVTPAAPGSPDAGP